jgi:hypothetical protein
MVDRDRVEELARHLLQEGHVQDEAEARLAAVEILLAQESRKKDPDAEAG